MTNHTIEKGIGAGDATITALPLSQNLKTYYKTLMSTIFSRNENLFEVSVYFMVEQPNGV